MALLRWLTFPAIITLASCQAGPVLHVSNVKGNVIVHVKQGDQARGNNAVTPNTTVDVPLVP